MMVGLVAVVLLVYTTLDRKNVQYGFSNSIIGFGSALMAAILGGINSVQIRAMGMKVHYATNVFALAMTGLAFCIFLAFAAPSQFSVLMHPSTVDLAVFAIVGICSFMMQVTLNKAFALAKAGPLVLFTEASTLAIQFLVDSGLGYRYSVFAWISAAIIGLYMVLHFGLSRSSATKQEDKVGHPAMTSPSVQMQKTASFTNAAGQSETHIGSHLAPTALVELASAKRDQCEAEGFLS